MNHECLLHVMQLLRPLGHNLLNCLKEIQSSNLPVLTENFHKYISNMMPSKLFNLISYMLLPPQMNFATLFVVNRITLKSWDLSLFYVRDFLKLFFPLYRFHNNSSYWKYQNSCFRQKLHLYHFTMYHFTCGESNQTKFLKCFIVLSPRL